MNPKDIRVNHYYRLIPDKAYWSPTLQRRVTVGRVCDNLIVKVTSCSSDPRIPLITGNLVTTFSGDPYHTEESEFELAFLLDSVIEPYIVPPLPAVRFLGL